MREINHLRRIIRAKAEKLRQPTIRRPPFPTQTASDTAFAQLRPFSTFNSELSTPPPPSQKAAKAAKGDGRRRLVCREAAERE